MVALGLLPAPNANGRWVWADVERAVLSRQAPIRRTEGTVYFIGFANYVKIGFTFNSVADRVAVLQIGAPETLVVFAQERGTMTREHELHRRFAAYRTRGEWFRLEGALAEYIAELVRG